MNQLTNDDVQAFIKQLVTLGGIDHLDDDWVILNDQNEPQCIQDGDKRKPIQILHSGMIKVDDNYIFNPLKTIEGNNPALTWFYSSRITIVACIVKQIILKLAELCVSKETENYDILPLVTGVSEFCDKQTLTELEKINGLDYLRLYYNRKTRTAEAQTMIFSDDAETQYKLRKKTWTVVRTLMRNLFKLQDNETTLSAYKYHATVLNLPEIDAKLHVLGQILEVIEEPAKLIGQDLHSKEFNQHLDNLEAYARIYAFFTAKTVQDKTVVTNHTPSGLPVRQNPDVPVIPIQQQSIIPAPPAPLVQTSPVVPSIPLTPPVPEIPVIPVQPTPTFMAPPPPMPGVPAPIAMAPTMATQHVVQPIGFMPPPPLAPTAMAPQPMASPYMTPQQVVTPVVTTPSYGLVPPDPPSPLTTIEKPVIKVG